MMSLPFEMLTECWTPAVLPTILEAGVVAFKILDVASQLFDRFNKALVVSGKLDIIHHQLL